ncbi:penicillin-binding protein [Natribacillus halophilus]|uniref:serine-type D-Ala-D-Ala carboxypeptidase n=1 Tax=Natribacillus halophilus TaxID=549003 RepID=A0A1G8MEJ0_9BACI|nr:penicillin-binding protein [Natribacillus halophilus]SDI66302.1 penicillin-binding protein 2B [Natribacillus halophilus]
MKRKAIIYRAIVLFGIAAITIAVLGGRFLFVQFSGEIDGVDLEALASERWTNEEPLHGERGGIYTADGEEVAEEVTSYTAYAIIEDGYEEAVEDAEATARELAPLIDMDENRLYNMLTSDQFQVELGTGARHLSYDEREDIEALGLDGIHFRTEPRRYYPNQDFASHVLGYFDRGLNEAVMGLEARLDQDLGGEEGSMNYQVSRDGVPLPGQNEDIQNAYDGNDVHLTLNANIQLALEQSMNAVEEEYDPERMTAIVAHAETGAVLGMSNRPSFNPNEYEDITNHTNFAVADHYEPGSTMKMFTMAAAVESGDYDGDEEFESGEYDPGYDTVISDHNDGEGWGTITYDEAVERSSNVGLSKLVNEEMGADTFYAALERFGFGEATGIELPREAEGVITDSELDAIYTGFGQASAVTPIQQIQAATAIANNGRMMSPYIVEEMVNPNVAETYYESEPEIAGEPISEDTAEEVREQLQEAVYGENATGGAFQVDGIDIAGKTGTAQIPSENGYLSGENQNIYSFLGMAPADDPEVVMYVAVDRPNLPADEAGTQPVSTIFNTVMQQSMQYFRMQPEESLSSEERESLDAEGIELEDASGMRTDNASEMIAEQNLEPFILGEGRRIEQQYPFAGEQVIAGENIFLVSDDTWEMPDMTGWSARDVVKFSTATGMHVEHEGTGYVTDQSMEPGSEAGSHDSLTVAFGESDEESDDEN